MSPFIRTATAVAAGVLVLSLPTAAHATLTPTSATADARVRSPRPYDENTVPGAEATTEETGPNRSLIAAGLVTFGVSYGSAAVIAATSEHPGDSHLFIPVAGPWMDIGDCGPCGPGTSAMCDAENSNKVLLGINGVFQGLGALALLAGILVPETHTVYEPAEIGKVKVHVTPASMGRASAGIAVFGEF